MLNVTVEGFGLCAVRRGDFNVFVLFLMLILTKSDFVVVLCCNSKTSSEAAPAVVDSSSTIHVEELSTASGVFSRLLVNRKIDELFTAWSNYRSSRTPSVDFVMLQIFVINVTKTKLWLFVRHRSENPSHPIGGAKRFPSLLRDILVTERSL